MKRIVLMLLAISLLTAASPSFAATKIVTWKALRDPVAMENLAESLRRLVPNLDFFESNAWTAGDLERDLKGARAFIFTSRSTKSALDEIAPALGPTLRKFAANGGLVVFTGDWTDWAAKAGLTSATFKADKEVGTLDAYASDDPLMQGLSKSRLNRFWLTYRSLDAKTRIHATIDGDPAVFTQDLDSGSILFMGYDFSRKDETAGRILARSLEGTSDLVAPCKPTFTLSLDRHEAKPGEHLTATASVTYRCEAAAEVEVKFFQLTPQGTAETLLPEPYFLSLMPGDHFDDTREIVVPGDALPGKYKIGLTLVDPVTGEALAREWVRLTLTER